MLEQIEFYQIPEEYEIELEFADNRINRKYHCRCDISHRNIVREVYDNYGEIIATHMADLNAMGLVKATVIAKHEIDFSEQAYNPDTFSKYGNRIDVLVLFRNVNRRHYTLHRSGRNYIDAVGCANFGSGCEFPSNQTHLGLKLSKEIKTEREQQNF